MAVERKKKEIRRKEIIECAVDLILSKQSRKLTLANIAGKMGVTEGSIYRHFKNKKEIMETLVRVLETNLIRSLTKVKRRKENPLKITETLLRSHLCSPKRQKEVAVVVSLIFSHLGDKPLQKRLITLVNSYIQNVEGIIREGQKAHVIREDIDAGAAASMLSGLIYGLTSLNYLMRLPKELLEHEERFWNIYLRGIQGGSVEKEGLQEVKS